VVLSFMIVMCVISDYAAKMEFVMEMEKSAAIMEGYDAEFALVCIIWFIPDKGLSSVFSMQHVCIAYA